MTKETLNDGSSLGKTGDTGEATKEKSSGDVWLLKDFEPLDLEADVGFVAETVEKLVRDADAALEACRALFGKVEGATKLKKRIASELKFLKSLKQPVFDISQVQSSNLRHLLGILHVAKTYPDVTHLLKNISSKSRQADKKGKLKRGKSDTEDKQRTEEVHQEEEDFVSITVDIICNQGNSWVKVVARNAQALHLIWAGRGHYGVNTLFFQAEDFLRLAKENPVNYAVPTVTFVFFNGVTTPMAEALQEMGVSVVGRRQSVSEETLSRLEALTDDEDEDEDDERRDKRLKSESSTSSCSSSSSSSSSSPPSETDFGDESIEGEYIVDDHFKGEEEEEPDLDAKLTSAFSLATAAEGVEASSALASSTTPDRRHEIGNSSVASVDTPSAAATDVAVSVPISTATTSALSTPASTVTKDLDPYSVPWKVGLKQNANPRVFLDISTMIAMTSSLCNGHADYVFEDKILSEQAERERDDPLLPTVEPILEGKELFTCQMAADDFRKILGIMGGPGEKARGEKLLASLTIVPDAPSTRSTALKESASIKSRAKVIFGTADSLKALICSANSGFVRAAGGQGVNFVVHIHQSRALTEEKQTTATKLV